MWGGFSRGNKGSFNRRREKRTWKGKTRATHWKIRAGPGVQTVEQPRALFEETQGLNFALPMESHTSEGILLESSSSSAKSWAPTITCSWPLPLSLCHPTSETWGRFFPYWRDTRQCHIHSDSYCDKGWIFGFLPNPQWVPCPVSGLWQGVSKCWANGGF